MKPFKYKKFVIRKFLDTKEKKPIYVAIPDATVGVAGRTQKEVKEFIDDINRTTNI